MLCIGSSEITKGEDYILSCFHGKVTSSLKQVLGNPTSHAIHVFKSVCLLWAATTLFVELVVNTRWRLTFHGTPRLWVVLCPVVSLLSSGQFVILWSVYLSTLICPSTWKCGADIWLNQCAMDDIRNWGKLADFLTTVWSSKKTRAVSSVD